MESRPFRDSTYDHLIWDKIWKTAWSEAQEKNWSKTRCVEELADEMEVGDSVIWRCIEGKKTKWRDDTREKMYKRAGYNSVNNFKATFVKEKNADDALEEETVLVEEMPVHTKKRCRYNIPLRPNYFIGRQEMLHNIHQRLTDTSGRHNILLLNGIGGMGKTTLMQEYLYAEDYNIHFDNIIAISVNKNLENAFIAGADQALNIGVKEIILREEKLLAVINAMKACEGENLFIIDNINEFDFDDLLKMKYTFGATRWKFLITTRTAPDDFERLQVDELNLEDAVLLFAYHYTPDDINRTDSVSLMRFITEYKLKKDIESLLTHSARHTLLTELLAKTGKKKGISVLQLLDILKQQDLKDKRLERMITIGQHSDHESRKELSQTTLYNYLFRLFDTDYLVKSTGNKAQDIENAEKGTMLQFFSVLPSEDIPVEDLKTLWAITPEAENRFEDRLDELKQIGWLQGKQENRKGYSQNITFSMHPLVQEVVYDRLRPTIASCRPLIMTLTAILPQLKSYPQKFQSYAKSAVDKLDLLSGTGTK